MQLFGNAPYNHHVKQWDTRSFSANHFPRPYRNRPKRQLTTSHIRTNNMMKTLDLLPSFRGFSWLEPFVGRDSLASGYKPAGFLF